jgi:hypothetical protein
MPTYGMPDSMWHVYDTEPRERRNPQARALRKVGLSCEFDWSG